MSRRRESHPPALVVAWRALLEAPRFGAHAEGLASTTAQGIRPKEKNMHFSRVASPRFCTNKFGESGWLVPQKDGMRDYT